MDLIADNITLAVGHGQLLQGKSSRLQQHSSHYLLGVVQIITPFFFCCYFETL